MWPFERSTKKISQKKSQSLIARKNFSDMSQTQSLLSRDVGREAKLKDIVNKLDIMMTFLINFEQKTEHAHFDINERIQHISVMRQTVVKLRQEIDDTIKHMLSQDISSSQIVSTLVEKEICSRATAYRYLQRYR